MWVNYSDEIWGSSGRRNSQMAPQNKTFKPLNVETHNVRSCLWELFWLNLGVLQNETLKLLIIKSWNSQCKKLFVRIILTKFGNPLGRGKEPSKWSFKLLNIKSWTHNVASCLLDNYSNQNFGVFQKKEPPKKY